MIRKNFFISLIVALILLTGIDTWAAAPTIQAKLISWTGMTTSQIKLKWVNGNGANRVVVMKQASAINATPLTDNTTYGAGGNVFGAGTLVDGSAYVVYNGSGNTVTVTGLSQGVTYYVQVYEYNMAPGDEDYYQVPNTNNPRNFTTPSTAATAPTTITVNGITGTSFDVTWSGATNEQGYYVWLAANTAFTTYGGVLDDYNAADIGNATQFTFDGLTTNNNSYYLKVASYNNSSTSSSATFTGNNANGQVAPLANEPTLNSLALTANVVTDNEGSNNTKMALSWTGGALNGTGTLKYIVLAQAGAAVTDVPYDGMNKTANSIFTSAPSVTATSKIVYDGTGTSSTITGLTANTQYTFKVFVYQTRGIDNRLTQADFTDRNYEPTGASATRYSLAAEQTDQASAPLYSALLTNGTGYTLGWSAAAGATDYIVVARSGSAPTTLPVDGTVYAGNANIGSAPALGNGFVVYSGTGTSVAITGLTPATQYYFAVYAAKVGADPSTINYYTVSPLSTNRYTLKAAVADGGTTNTVTNAATETVSTLDKGINIAFTAGASIDSVLVVISTDGDAPAAPVNGTSYTSPTNVKVGNNYTVTLANIIAGTDIGSSDFVAYAGASTAANILITGLNTNTLYQVAVTQYMKSVNTTDNYNTPSVTSRYSISTTPTAQVTGLNASAFTTNTIQAAWTDAADPATLVSIKAGAGITNHPVDGTGYTPNLAFASGPDLGSLTYVVNSSSAASPITITGLTPSTLYTINAYSYKDDNAGALNNQKQRNYKITSPQSIQRFTLAAPQTTDAAALTYSNVTSSGMSVVVGGATTVTNTKYLVVVTPGGTPNTVDPVDGLGNYAGTANTATTVNYSTLSQLYSPAGVDQAGAFVLYDGPAATIAITNMSAKTQYSFSVWAYNTALTAVTGATESNNDKAFKKTTPTTGSRFTTATEATAQAGATTITSPTLTGMTYSVASGATATGNTLGYLSVIDVAGTEEVPADGTGYTAATNFTGTVLTTDARVVYDGSSLPTAVVLTGLASNTNYTIRTYAYAWDGTNAQTKNYLTTSPSEASKYTLATQPDDMLSIGTTTNRTTTTATLNWTEAQVVPVVPGTNALLTMAQSSDANAVAVADAVDGTSYTAVSAAHAWNSALLNGSTYVAWNGLAGTQTINLTGLTPNKRYDIEGVMYNGATGTGAENYSNATVTNNFFTLSTEPTAQVTNFAAGVTADATTSINLTWTAAAFTPTDGSTVKYLVVANTGPTATGTLPVDGTNYTVSDNDFSTDDLLAAGEQLVYQGTGTSITVSGLAAETQYSFVIYAYAEGLHTSTVNYNTTSAPTVTRYTLKAVPGANATVGGTPFSLSTNSGATSGVTFSWAANGNTNFLVVVSPAAHTADPVDGTGYTADANYAGTGSTLGNGKVVYSGTGTSVAVTGLTAATTYEFTVYGFAQGSSADQTNNYRISDEASASTTTLAQPITAEATALNVDNLAVGTYRLNWTAATGPNTIGYVVVAKSGAFASTFVPTDGTGYTAVDTDPDNTTSAQGDGEVVYNGSNTTVTLTGLSDATAYTFVVYGYNWNGSNISSRNYGTISTTGSSAYSRISLNTVPAVQAASSAGTRTTSSIAVTYNYPNGTATPNSTLVSIRPFVSSVTNPTVGRYYGGLTSGSTNATGGSPAVQLSPGSSTVVSTTGFIQGSYPTALNITGLTAGTQYTINTYALNCVDTTLGSINSDANYNTTTSEINAWTLATAPVAPTLPVYSALATTSYRLDWTPSATAGVDGYIVIAKQGASISTGAGNEPAGGTTYSDPANLAFGGDAFGGNELMYVGTNTNVTITGLTANTQYTFAIYAYENTVNAAAINYSSALTTSRYTLKAAPTAAPTLSVVPATKGTTTLVFTATVGAGGADKVVVYALKGNTSPATTPTTAAPANGTAGTVVGGASILTTGTGVLVYDGVFGASAVSLTSLDNATYYSFVAYAYNTGASTETNNYFGTASAVLSTNTLSTEPTTAAGNPAISSKTDVTINFTVTNGDGSASLVSNQQLTVDGIGVVATPVDGTDYTANAAFGSGSLLGGTGVRVKKIGNATTGSITGLTAATQYIIRAYSYNGTSTGLANYKTDAYGETTVRTLATAPTSGPGAITFANATYDAIANTSGYTVNWTAASGATGTTKYLVIGKPTTASNFSPTNGTAYTTLSNIGDGTVYYVGTALTTGAITGLTPNTSYNWRIFAYDDLGFAGSENYFGTAATTNQVTIPANPHVFTNVAALTKTAVTDLTIDLSWTTATATETNTTTPTGYIVIGKSGGAVTSSPTDGVTVNADNFFGGGTDIGTSEFVVYKGAGTSVQVTNLNSQTTYYFKVLSYTQGTPSYSANYSSNSAVTGTNVNNLTNNFSTLATAPGSAPSGMAVSARTNNTITTTWAAGTGAAKTLISQKTTAFVNGTDDPVNGTGYTAPTTINGASVVANAAQVATYSYTGLTPDTKYFFRVYDYNDNATAAMSNYGTGTNYASTSGYTLANQPSAQVVLDGTIAVKDGTSLTIPFTYGGSAGDSIMVLVKTTDITLDPTDGTPYNTGATIGGATVNTKFVYSANGNINVTGLSAGTSYYVAAFAYKGSYNQTDGISTANYEPTIGTTNGVGSNKVQLSTISVEPSPAPSGVTVSARTTTGQTISWTQPSGARTLVLAREANATAPNVLDAVDYNVTPSLTYASAGTVLTNYKVLYDGAATTSITAVLPNTGTQYYYYVYAYNVGGANSQNYTAAATGNHYTLATAPTGASTGLTTGSSNAGGSIDLAWSTADDNAKTLLVRRSDGSAPTAPTSGVNYTSTVDVNTTIVTDHAAGATDAKTYTVTGLTPGTTYQFNAYAYRGGSVTGTTPDAGTEGTNNYTAGAGVVTVVARSAEPTNIVTGLMVSNITSGGATLNWTAPIGGADRYLVVISGSTINTPPVDGTKYGNLANYSTNETNAWTGLTSGAFNGSTSHIIYNGTATTVNITGTPSGQSISVAVFAFNEATTIGSENYIATLTDASNRTSFTTLNSEPTTSTSGLTATPAGTSISIAYTAGNGSNRLVVYKAGGAPTFVPVDGTTYNNGDQPVTGEYVINTASTPVVLTGLTSNTTYHYAFYEYNGSGAQRNYKQSSPATGNAQTTSAPVLTSLAFTAGNALSYNTTSTNFTIELRDGSNAAIAETTPRTITLKLLTNASTSYTLGTVTTTAGPSSFNINSVNVPSLVNSGNGTLTGTLWATTDNLTAASHGSSNISVVATDPTVDATINNINRLTIGQHTVSVDFGANSGYVLWARAGTDIGTPELSLVDGTVYTADNAINTSEKLAFIGSISAIFTGLTSGNRIYYKAIPYRGNAANATVNYGQDRTASKLNNTVRKQAQYTDDFNENIPNVAGFDVSDLEQNPVKDYLKFNIHSFTNQVFNVEIISNTGEKVANGIVNSALGRGKHLINIPLSENLASGTYYIMVISGSEMVSIPFVIVK